MFKANGVIHSKEGAVEKITVLEKYGDNDYIVVTEDGVKCHALFNYFNGYYYADDLYRKVEDEKTTTTGYTSDSQ